jgi:carbamoyltransferase
VIVNGDVVAAAKDERFSRKKHDSGFPCQGVGSRLASQGLTQENINSAVYYEGRF